ncbi:hypothetical protein Pmani_005551 [Petrolisthes manimaculis]|uniref:ATPase dynein-related AAA domain-containing protein n=1 Tax=Petrolisthes manimaculis TaxID=1843537 RepID=A0AAE1UM36_9EUCA|nr:hypothetical protein Pmani_005551 [Petrolisthes manimaculis]
MKEPDLLVVSCCEINITQWLSRWVKGILKHKPRKRNKFTILAESVNVRVGEEGLHCQAPGTRFTTTKMQQKALLGRLHVLSRILANPTVQRHPSAGQFLQICKYSDASKVTIGDVTKQIIEPKHPELVPIGYLKGDLPQSTLQHLRWLLQKDQLGQDVFLIGPPGPARRLLAMAFLQLTKREAEFVSLTRDTTEGDLKQRREIKAGTSFYCDQSAVRAAVEGRVLVVEGVEKAERNVLPVLNNLLENREMQLEDGRLLIAANRYDKLLQEHSQEELDQMRLVRVDQNFRVIALGLPSPPYQGHPLDPPLRSRFQARHVASLNFKGMW